MRLREILPITEWLGGYSLARLGPDGVAGLSLAAFVIPESLAYASLAGLPPVSGLYCYLAAGLAYAVFGTSRQLAVGPTSALALAVAAGIAVLIGGDPARAAALAAAIALMVGAIAIGGRFLGLANLAYFFSDSVLTGFKTGAALYIASTQLPKLLELEGSGGNFFARLVHVGTSLPDASLPSLAIGLLAIALFLLLERALPGRPTTLIVVAAAIAATAFLGLGRSGVRLVGDLPQGLPALGLPPVSLADLGNLVPTAFACFLLAYSEAISVARSFAQKRGYEIDPAQELTALGASNVAVALLRGFPVSGGMSQTAVNDMNGATSPVSLVVTSIVVALTLAFFTGLFRNLPEPVLAAIILMAAKHLVRLEELRELKAASRMEFAIALAALFGVLAFGPLQGLLLAAIGALVILIARASRPAVAVLARDPVSGHYVNKERYPTAEETPSVLVLRSAGAWVYFNAEQIRRRFLDFVAQAETPVETVVIDCSTVPAIDMTALASLRAFAGAMKRRGITVQLAELRDDVADFLHSRGAEGDLGPIVAHRTVDQLVAARGTAGRDRG
ncbi:MAG: SulP family inorganic anion transporter [Reyranella sp.]